jgi:hypothetical protein
MGENSYDEPVKAYVRRLILTHAVRALTTERDSTPLVSEAVFARTLDYARTFIKQVTGQDVLEAIEPLLEYWLPIHRSRISSRKPEDLQVLIVSGPSPLNDLEVLMELGVPPHNVWAVEGDKQVYAQALASLQKLEGFPLRLYRGSLQEFFAVVPQQFDIIYFDACGPLLGGRPSTLPVIRELFVNQRLAPVSALITNFCVANMEGDAAQKWAKRMQTWYAARYDEPCYFTDMVGVRVESHRNEEDTYLEHIEENLQAYYEDFVTRFVVEFSSLLLPWWRVLALPGTKREFFAKPEALSLAMEASTRTPEKINKRNLIEGFGHACLAPEAYPYVWAVKLAEEILDEGDPLRALLTTETIRGTKLAEAIRAISLVRHFFESQVSWGKHNRDACSPEFAKMLEEYRWFDSEGQPWYRMFCDIPMPNLVADLCFGQSGYPYHTNVAKLLRLTYTAKVTPMLTDVFVLDQCRYLYDLVPSPSLFGQELPFPVQMVLRICIDAIRRHAHSGIGDLFWGSGLASIGEDGFTVVNWPPRQEITPDLAS